MTEQHNKGIRDHELVSTQWENMFTRVFNELNVCTLYTVLLTKRIKLSEFQRILMNIRRIVLMKSLCKN